MIVYINITTAAVRGQDALICKNRTDDYIDNPPISTTIKDKDMRFVTLIAMTLIISATIPVVSSASDTVIEGIKTRQTQIFQTLIDAAYKGRSISREYDGKKALKRETVVKRNIWLKGHNLDRSEVTSIVIDGKEIDPKDMKKQMGGGGESMRAKMPFQSATWDDYAYTNLGPRQWHGMTVDAVGFKPLKKGEGYIRGTVYTVNGDITFMEFSPAKNVAVMKNSSFTMEYHKTGGYWLPKKFAMSIEVEVKAVFSFMHLFIEMTEDYSDYRLNTGLKDAFFRKD